jgi:hypothetical protein
VLSIVTIYAGPTLQHRYIASPIIEETYKISPPAIAQTALDLIGQIPEVANDPALWSTTAAEQLLRMMQLVIAQWITKQHMDALNSYSEDGQLTTADLVDKQRAESGLFPQALISDATHQGQPLAEARNRRPLLWAQNGSSARKSIQELTTAQSPSSRLTAESDAGASPQTEMQEQVLIDFSLDRLNNL